MNIFLHLEKALFGNVFFSSLISRSHPCKLTYIPLLACHRLRNELFSLSRGRATYLKSFKSILFVIFYQCKTLEPQPKLVVLKVFRDTPLRVHKKSSSSAEGEQEDRFKPIRQELKMFLLNKKFYKDRPIKPNHVIELLGATF